MQVWQDIYANISTLENIFLAWEEFRKHKKSRRDVLFFERYLENNLFKIHEILKNQAYKSSKYSHFYIRDPKLRLIHKAPAFDRVIHHIVSKKLEEIFEPTFYAHSYSCRRERGTHKALVAFRKMAIKVSRNNSRTCWALKCDIKKYFSSINHQILINTLKVRIKDENFLALIYEIIDGFYSDKTTDISNKKGVPIGNLTSQHFANIYLDKFDLFVKHDLKVKYYVRYADDFIVLSNDLLYLKNLIVPIQNFLKDELDLEMHEDKIIFRKFKDGVDFLGYVNFPNFILPRTKTKKRMYRKIRQKIKEYRDEKITIGKLNETVQSYLGYLGHANTYKLKRDLKNTLWFWLTE